MNLETELGHSSDVTALVQMCESQLVKTKDTWYGLKLYTRLPENKCSLVGFILDRSLRARSDYESMQLAVDKNIKRLLKSLNVDNIDDLLNKKIHLLKKRKPSTLEYVVLPVDPIIQKAN